MRKITAIFSLLVLCASLWRCDSQDGYKSIHDLKESQWAIDSVHRFTFTITDTNKSYDFYYLIRNATAYPFYNLYIKRSLTDTTGKMLSQSMEELLLFDKKSGKPAGSGLGDIFDHKFRIKALAKYRFAKSGVYTFSVEQNMRQDPLLGIMSVGVAVEPTYSEQ